VALGSALSDESTDGRSWLLVVENAQHASHEVWTEIRAFVHAMEASAGFSGLVLVGPTELARQLSARRLIALAARLATHVHLLPLDLDETRELVQCEAEAVAASLQLLEELHRDTGGNPRRLLQLLRKGPRTLSSPAILRESTTLVDLPEPMSQRAVATPNVVTEPVQRAIPAAACEGPASSRGSESSSDLPVELGAGPLVPSRPPLRVEEGLIEVGWEGCLEAESAAAASTAGAGTIETVASPLPPVPDEAELPSEEMIEDHYAALQAWTEWARNRGRAPEVMAAGVRSDRVQPVEAAVNLAGQREAPAEPHPSALIRAEPQHEHAPYSQLFSRLRQAR
jgi:hypothetical protein